MSGKLKIAVTGGYGSGKSSVCEIISEKGYPVIKADFLAKNLLNENPEVKKEVIQSFGGKSYSGDLPNKNFLAEIVFNDPEKLEILNSIIHPRTIKIIEEKMSESLKKSDLVFVESALIYEAKRVKHFDYIILVSAEEEIRISRIEKRDGLQRDEIRKRISNQLSEEEKRKRADFIIENNGVRADLKNRVDFVLSVIKSTV